MGCRIEGVESKLSYTAEAEEWNSVVEILEHFLASNVLRISAMRSCIGLMGEGQGRAITDTALRRTRLKHDRELFNQTFLFWIFETSTIRTNLIPRSTHPSLQKENHLVLILIRLVSNNVEELEAVLSLGGGDDTQPVAKLLLLEELLSQVLEVATAEVLVSHDLDLSISEVVDDDVLAEVTGAAIDLDALLEEGRESGRVEDAVLGGLLGVDDELIWMLAVWSHRAKGDGVSLRYLLGGRLGALLGCAGGGLLLYFNKTQPTALCRTTIQGVGGQNSEIHTVAGAILRWMSE